MQVTVEEHPEDGDLLAVRRGLESFNIAHTGDAPILTPLRILVRDEEGRVRGGLLGGTYWGWLVIESVWLDESVRGRGCHAAHLDTMTFRRWTST
jgi:hypothetical protein